MPFKSSKQKAFFGVCAGNPQKARSTCPPRKVIDEFFRADRKAKGKKK